MNQHVKLSLACSLHVCFELSSQGRKSQQCNTMVKVTVSLNVCSAVPKVGVISASIPLENYDCCNNCCQIKPVAWSLNPVLTLELIAASFPVIQNLRQTRWNRYTHIYLKLFQHFNWFRLISGCWFHIGCQFLSITSQFCTTTYQWFYEILCQRVKWML